MEQGTNMFIILSNNHLIFCFI